MNVLSFLLLAGIVVLTGYLGFTLIRDIVIKIKERRNNPK